MLMTANRYLGYFSIITNKQACSDRFHKKDGKNCKEVAQQYWFKYNTSLFFCILFHLKNSIFTMCWCTSTHTHTHTHTHAHTCTRVRSAAKQASLCRFTS